MRPPTTRPTPAPLLGRRAVSSAALLAALLPRHLPARADSYVSRALPAAEYTNSIIASKDTNISPKEVYDTIRLRCSPESPALRTSGRALDLGAGAGASTQALFELGWPEVVAVDPSRVAWDRYAGESLPRGISFVHASDEAFMTQWRAARGAKFDLVVINYAMNRDKAEALAVELLASGGRLLAPTNAKPNFWFEQVYTEHNERGELLWSQATVGKWDVIFQPDFTSETCQGQWCPGLRADAEKDDLRL